MDTRSVTPDANAHAHNDKPHWVLLCGITANPETALREQGLRNLHVVTLMSSSSTLGGQYADLAAELLKQIKQLVDLAPAHIQMVTPSDGEGAILQGLGGLLKTTALEHKGLVLQSIAVDSGIDAGTLATYLIADRLSPENEIRYLGALRNVRILEEVTAPQASNVPSPWRDEGTYLISGGAGGLGLILAEAITKQAVGAKLLLLGRTDLSTGKQGTLQRIQALGPSVSYHQVDISDTAALRSLLSSHGPITTVIHCAGVLQDGLLRNKSTRDLLTVLSPKVDGTLALDDATRDQPLEAFILFSSTSSVFGNPGQSDYAMANGFLDGFAELRNQWASQGKRHGQAMSINWPFWSDGGMDMPAEAQTMLKQLLGITPLRTSDGLSTLNQLLALNAERTIVLSGEQNRLRQNYLSRPTLPTSGAPRSPSTHAREDKQLRVARQFLVELLCDRLKLSPSQIEGDVPFDQYGLDSVIGTDLVGALEQRFGSVPKMVFFEYTTLNDLASYLAEHHLDDAATGIATTPSIALPVRPTKQTPLARHTPPPTGAHDIAIIGISGRYPDADDLATFWENLASGVDSIREVPEQRWHADAFYSATAGHPEASRGKWGAFIDDIESFDPLLFGISPKDASFMNPKERLFLQTVWSLLENGGYSRQSISQRHNRQVGVYVGAMYQQSRSGDSAQATATSIFSKSSIPNRVSHFFGLEGPSIAVDSMCSSAAMAIHLACKDIRLGECELAIAGAINLNTDPKKFIGLSHLQLLASHPDSRSFGDGDGYLPSDSIGAALLKPLSRAISDGDRIHAVIKGSATSHGGSGVGYMVPSAKAQQSVIKKSLEQAGIPAGGISYVEAAANGTPLADAIEVSVLNRVFKGLPELPVGAVKSNLGHPEAASGMAQLSKVILQFQHRQLAPTIKLEKLNPKLDLQGSPIRLQRELADWPAPLGFPRRALINSFGAGGSCVSLILEEFESNDALGDATGAPELLVLSAMNKERLAEYLRRLLGHLRKHPSTRLADVALTLQEGREMLPERMAFVAASAEDMLSGFQEALAALEQQRAPKPPVSIINSNETRAQLKQLFPDESGSDFVRMLADKGDLDRLALYWAQGGSVDWPAQRLSAARKIDLPGYPFEPRRFPLPPLENGGAHTPMSATNVAVETTNALLPYEHIAAFLLLKLELSESDIEPTRNLREYGLESVNGMALMRSIEQTFGVQLEGRALLEHPSIEALAQHVRSLLDTTGSPTAISNVSIDRPASVKNRFALSEGQQGLWVIQKRYPALAAYNIPICTRVPVQIDAEALRTALAQLCQEQPLLSATIDATDDNPVHTLHPNSAPIVEEHDAHELDESSLLKRMRDIVKTPINLDSGSLLRTSVFRTSKGDVLLIVVHHLIFDGRSLPLFLGRLLEIYISLGSGAPALPRASLATYADFVDWEREMLESPRGASHREFWHKQLKAPLPLLSLPTDHPRSHFGTTQGATHTRQIDADTHEATKSLAGRLGVTPAVLYLGLYLILLQRHSRESDIVVGMPTVGRPEQRFDDIVGYFVNMIAVRAELRDGQAFPEFLQQLQNIVVDSLDHAAYPFPRLVRELRHVRHKGYSPVFQVAFEYQSETIFQWQPEAPPPQAAQLAASLEYIQELRQEGEFELALEIQSFNGNTSLHMKYAPELFKAQRIERLTDHYFALLDACLSQPQQALDSFPEAEHNRPDHNIASKGHIDVPHPDNLCLHDLISQQAARTPDAVAVRYLDTTLSYSELEQKTTALAKALIADGLAPHGTVGVCVTRSPDMIVALVAVMKAGGIYVPLDPQYPVERLRHMIEDSGCRSILTQQASEQQLRAVMPVGVTTLCLDRDGGLIDKRSRIVTELPQSSADALIYIIYTSGSTGKPKGVMIEHKSVINLLYSLREKPGFKTGERLLALATYSFDIAVVELFLPLVTGGECCLCDAETLRDGQLLKAEIERLQPDYIQATPMTWTMLLRAGWKSSGHTRMVTTGEALPTVLRDQFVAEGMLVWNMYGPTETTIYATCWRVNDSTPVLIGLPLNNTRAYILDETGAPVPTGARGELYIAGDGVARGYWNRETLTHERFVDSCFVPGERLYKTGDLARWHPSGELEYMGRLDDQVKIRGYRIELGEIETLLARHPLIAQAAVTVEKLHDSSILVAHYVPESDPVSDATLRTYMGESLPAYMIPSRFAPISALPQTPSGKVDRKALASKSGPNRSTGYSTVGEQLEAKILTLWRKFFSNELLTPDDSFFEVGGDSMLAQSMIHTLEQELGLSLTTNTLFAHDTARSLARAISGQPDSGRPAPQQALDLLAEATLDPDITPAAPTSAGNASGNVLLTGATGFLGAHLLAELLAQTGATVYCLVRADDDRQAEIRLIETLKHYGLWRQAMQSRLNPIAGRLDKPLLGLGQARFEALSTELDAIYHNGAMINHSYPYLLMKPTNVEGTAEVLRLACRGKATPVHHISTISVQDFSAAEIDEELLIPHHRFLQGGYIQSKWVAEQLVCLAHQRGLPVTIYRPSRIVGHTRSGIMNTDDLFCRMIKSAAILGVVPDSGFYDNIIPVDDVSRFIVSASLQNKIKGRALHVTNPLWYHSDQLNVYIHDQGFDIKRVPVHEWLERLEEQARQNPSHPLAALLPMFRGHDPGTDNSPLKDQVPGISTRSTDSLEKQCFRIPARSLNEMLPIYFNYFYSTDFIPAAEVVRASNEH